MKEARRSQGTEEARRSTADVSGFKTEPMNIEYWQLNAEKTQREEDEASFGGFAVIPVSFMCQAGNTFDGHER